MKVATGKKILAEVIFTLVGLLVAGVVVGLCWLADKGLDFIVASNFTQVLVDNKVLINSIIVTFAIGLLSNLLGRFAIFMFKAIKEDK